MKKIISFAVISLLAACSTTPTSYIDASGVDAQQYEVDLRECQQQANVYATSSTIKPNVNIGVGVGTGHYHSGVGLGISFGLDQLIEMTKAEQANKAQMRIIEDCMSAKGYRIIRKLPQ